MGGHDANGLVKEEFQEAMKWLVVPLIKQHMRKRVEQHAPTFSQVPVSQVHTKWRQKWQGCHYALKHGVWVSELLEEEKANASTMAKVAFRAVKPLVDACPDLEGDLSTAREAFAKGKVLVGGVEDILRVHNAFESMAALLQRRGKRYECAYKHVRAAMQSVLAVCDLLKAYEPSEQPFALLLDNCTAHSMTDSEGKMRHIIPLLQVSFR